MSRLFALARSAFAPALLAAGAALAGDARPRAYVVFDGAAIPAPLTGETPDIAAMSPPGDPARGETQARRFCAGCHALPGAPEPPHHDDALGPSLIAVGARMDAGALRLAVVNLAIARPAAEGHAYYDLPPADPEAPGPVETALTAQTVEDLVAYLGTLGR